MTKMEEQVFGGLKDLTAYFISYKFLLLLIDSHIITGLFALSGIVLGRILDWSWESYKKRRDRRKPRKKLGA